MRKPFIALSGIVALVALLAWAASASQAASPSPRLAVRAQAGVAGRALTNEDKIVVRYRDGVPGVAGSVHGSTFGVITDVGARSGLHVIEVPVGQQVDRVLAALRQDPIVAEAGISYVAQAFDAPNDTNYAYQWHMHNTVGGIQAEGAWPLAPNGGQSVVVAVLDTGVAYENYDGSLGGVFPQHFVQSPDLATTTFVDPKDYVNSDTHANDDNGHGSHVAGTITQDTNNNYGVAGVAFNSTIMPIKVLDFGGFGADAHTVEAIHYAVDHGADVISMSLGFAATGTPDENGVYCTEIIGLNAALEYAYANGVVVVAAAGNESGGPVACPAAHPTVISVAGSRFDGQIAPYSNAGVTLDVTAPGGDSSIDQNGDGFTDGVVQDTYCYDWLSLLFSGSYDAFCDIFMSGTSMATPHVSGLAALLLGENDSLTPDQVRSYIESTARDRGAAGWDPVYGWGVIDAQGAVSALIGGTPATPTPSPTQAVTDTPTPTDTPTAPPVPTDTPTPTDTPPPPTATNTPTATATPVPLGPDLIETCLNNQPATVRRDNRFTATDRVQNQGTTRAVRSTTRYYLSFDQERNAGDILLLGVRSIAGLNAGEGYSGNTRVRVPSSTALGLYYVIVCADDTLRVAELDELNNCRASATRVQITT